MSDKHEEAVELIESRAEAVDGRYTIGNVLGYGRAGISVQARDVSGRLVALKVAWKDQDARDHLRRETELTAKVEHPNVLRPQLIDVPEPLLVAESPLMSSTLGSLLDSRKPTPYETVRGILDVIGAALDSAHTVGVVHGGILPEKIFIDGQGKYFISDFALRLPQAVFVDGNRPSTVGFAPYTPVEQRHDLTSCNGRIDQFALAVVAYELLRGTRTWRFNEEGVLEIDAIDMVVSRPIATGVPMSASAAVRRATSREAGYRYASMNEFVRAFAGLGKTATPSEHMVKEGFAVKRRHAWMWAVPAAAAVLSAAMWMQPEARDTANRFWEADWTSSSFWKGDWIMKPRFGDERTASSQTGTGGTRRGGNERSDGTVRGQGNTRVGDQVGSRAIDPYPRNTDQASATTNTDPPPRREPGDPRSSAAQTAEAATVTGSQNGGRQGTSQQGSSSSAAMGALAVSIDGAGAADVYIDGIPRGRTPITWTGSPGRHIVTLRPASAFSPSSIQVTVAAGSTARAVFSPK